MKSKLGSELCHCLAARRSARHMTRLYDRHLASSGLSISQFSLLAVIDEHPGISVALLSELMVMERTTLLRALKPLRADGLLLCESHGAKSALNFKLSDAGKDKLASADPHWKAAQIEFEDQVGVAKATQLRDTTLAIVFNQ